MIRIRAAAAALLVLTLTGQQLAACAGWDSSEQARMECCQRMAGCDDPAIATECCAAGEQGDRAAVNPAVAVPPPGAVRHVGDFPVPRLVRVPASGPPSVVPHTFRNAVLLI